VLIRHLLLKQLYSMFPFSLKGDCPVSPERDDIIISCVINFYGRLDLLEGILHSLAQQEYPAEQFEVVLVEDKGGTEAGRALIETFKSRLNIVYVPLDKQFGRMGYSRNFGVLHSRGKIVLFLDDDTVILQKDFLEKLENVFTKHLEIDAVIPHGMASFSLVEDRYNFHDPYFMTSRCTAYQRRALTDLSGFMNHFVGQEDVEFVIRFHMAGKLAIQVPELEYYHPPLLVPNFSKPQAVGNSFYGLKSRYPFVFWLLAILNCARHAPLYLLPVKRYREMGRFGLGFMAGVVVSIFKKNGFKYS